ncbi:MULTISPECIES: DUF7344 domain-containing protein [Haloarcula]|uniref:DUF7344 domain-containing protein n=1 Tax=Haloarcula TaxID=2237 RepID=UPI0023ED3AF0|nr:hypothetical protein [Halomicroarcula sp. XH51]
MSTDKPELSRDRVFDILSSPRRRYVLHYLRTEESPIELTALAEEVAAWENDTTVEKLSSQDRKRVYVSLYQTHIPKLSEAGLIEYDSESGDVALSNQAAEIDPYLGTENDERPWYLYYMVLAAANVALLASTSLGFLGIGETVVAFVVVASFLVLTAVHAAMHYREQSGTSGGFEEM